MNRKQVLIIAAVLGLILLVYAVGFGPVIFLLVTAERHGVVPGWLQQQLVTFFHPHLWLMYHQEWYFNYIAWFIERAEKIPLAIDWQDFRTLHAEDFGP